MKTWVFCLPTNTEFWAWDEDKQDYTPRVVTTEQARRIVAETLRALAFWASIAPEGSAPYTPPVLREHKREGQRYGSIVGIKLSGVLEKRGIWLQVDWLDATYEDIEAYKSQHVSIGTVKSYRDGSGEVFGPLVNELSLTEHPRLRGIGSIQDTLTLRLSDAMEKSTMTEEEIMALLEPHLSEIATLKEELTTLKEEVATLKKEEPDETPEEVVETADEEGEDKMEELATKLSDRIFEKLEAKRVGGRAAGAPPVGKKPQTTVGKLEVAKKSGLKGMAAIEAALK
jgi:hypothetical protein